MSNEQIDNLPCDNFTEQEINHHLQYPDACPACKGTDIEGGFVEINGREANQEVSCTGCGALWVDTFTLSGVQKQ
ncbi:hypothetical protein [Vibrio parahaemolyticus]|uniref:hypothetical protein n=1 Tax=Vibrio parahaemolyticus TaxID=670 RepID=UPI000812CDD4|nr:hypothetical protein [Vibrio parahaemolyticus]OCP68223.1 hypothetical protein AKH08_15510 [Vibrio parahaemolyticus]